MRNFYIRIQGPRKQSTLEEHKTFVLYSMDSCVLFPLSPISLDMKGGTEGTRAKFCGKKKKSRFYSLGGLLAPVSPPLGLGPEMCGCFNLLTYPSMILGQVKILSLLFSSQSINSFHSKRDCSSAG